MASELSGLTYRRPDYPTLPVVGGWRAPELLRAGTAPVERRRSRTIRSKARSRQHLLDQEVFRDVLTRERLRADRFEQPFALITVRADAGRESLQWANVADALEQAAGETAIVGWYEQDRELAVIVPELGSSPDVSARIVHNDVHRDLAARLSKADSSSLSVRMHVHALPNAAIVSGAAAPNVDLAPRHALPLIARAAKRALDITASLALLLVLSPLWLLIAVLVKLDSPGPILFRQTRVGLGARPFTMLKFRTMRWGSDVSLHRSFVTRLITGNEGSSAPGGLFKIVDDPRVTAVGRILRRSSMDELPQLLNVLRGEMSLVGPRPPLPYEVEHYKSWHWRRVLDAKPGITGLWQVTGRSRTTFDEMVRMDLRYASSTSLWTDLRILLATPRAVVTGKGAC
jgi:lipopolysaccharide/colanic/teichoic acid biosynthesis glycosyltransferase